MTVSPGSRILVHCLYASISNRTHSPKVLQAEKASRMHTWYTVSLNWGMLHATHWIYAFLTLSLPWSRAILCNSPNGLVVNFVPIVVSSTFATVAVLHAGLTVVAVDSACAIVCQQEKQTSSEVHLHVCEPAFQRGQQNVSDDDQFLVLLTARVRRLHQRLAQTYSRTYFHPFCPQDASRRCVEAVVRKTKC